MYSMHAMFLVSFIRNAFQDRPGAFPTSIRAIILVLNTNDPNVCNGCRKVIAVNHE